MAHFYSTTTGSRTTAVTKTGTKDSGIQTHARGWNFGIKVELIHKDGNDLAIVWATKGSNDPESWLHLGTFKRDRDTLITVHKGDAA